MENLVIDRSKWRTGGDQTNEEMGLTQLLNDEGNMCCLGFFCIQSGLDYPEIKGVPAPDMLRGDRKHKVPHLLNSRNGSMLNNSELASNAIKINDNPNISDEDREARLTELFKEHGINVTFENEYPQL